MSVDKNKAMAQRVEEARLKIIAEREEKRAGAVKITAQLLKGIDYEEEVVVRLVNGQYGLLTIKPLAEGKIIELFAELGINRLENLGQSGKLSLEDYDFFWSIVALSSKIDKELLKSTFAVGESSIVAQRVLKISGFTEGTSEEVESFLK